METPHWSFLIAAAGSGSRLGGTPKQFRVLAGRPVWRWSYETAERLRSEGALLDIVLVLPAERIEEFAADCERLHITIARGGATRSESVLNGLEKCRGSHVLVHDGARPFITEDLLLALMSEAEEHGAAVPLLRCADALKKIDGSLLAAADRNIYLRTQTPQAFRREELTSLLRGASPADDEASLWTASGRGIARVDGDERNFKITTQFDWEMACAMAENDIERRTGHGFDIHRLAEGRPLIIAGVKVAGVDFGLFGHSDADVVTHAVMDALLGAAGEADIGTLFPASDEKWRGADSITLLRSVLALLASKGWRAEWVDATLIAQRPKLGALLPQFREKLNAELGGGGKHPRFNIKVKSAEECGSAGRGECMICHCVAEISRIAL